MYKDIVLPLEERLDQLRRSLNAAEISSFDYEHDLETGRSNHKNFYAHNLPDRRFCQRHFLGFIYCVLVCLSTRYSRIYILRI